MVQRNPALDLQELTLLSKPVPLRFTQLLTASLPVNLRPRKPGSCQRSMRGVARASMVLSGWATGEAKAVEANAARRMVVNCMLMIWIGGLDREKV
jgi:hypothetical protein